MKRLILIVLTTVLVACAGFAQPTDVDIVYSGMIPRVLVWNAPTLDENGDPIVGTLQYNVWVSLNSDHSRATFIGSFADVQGTIDISSYPAGYYYVGVSAFVLDAEGNPVESGIAWSNSTVATDPTGCFAWLVVRVPLSPTGLETLP